MEKNKQTVFAIIAVICIVIISSLLLKGKAPSSTSPVVTPVKTAVSQTYTLSLVASHNSKTDCWMVIEGKVYDVTSYVPNHNPDIIQGCGKEATTLFEGVRKHAGAATSILNEYLIGTLQN